MYRVGFVCLEALILNPFESANAPIRWAHVPLKSGLNIVYGLNGAGKSLILDAFKGCIEGRESRASQLNPALLVSLDPSAWQWADYFEEFAPVQGVADFYRSFEQPSEVWDGMLGGPGETIDVEGLRARIVQVMSMEIEKAYNIPSDIYVDQLASEVISQRLFLLHHGPEPVGQPCIRRQEDAPMLMRFLEWIDQDEPSEPGLGATRIWKWNEDDDVVAAQPGLYEVSSSLWEIRKTGIKLFGSLKDPDAATGAFISRVGRWVGPFGEGDSARTPSQALTRLIAAEQKYLDMEMNVAEHFDKANWDRIEGESLAEDSGIRQLTKNLQHSANLYYSRVLMDAPSLEVDFGTVNSWISGSGIRWGARRSPSSNWVELANLSEAERKWALISIELALAVIPRGVLVIDEPEQALHRSAESYMARGLDDLASELELCVFVATHSTELLNRHGAQIHLVRRRDQGLIHGQQVHRLEQADRESLLAFGLLPSDLLRRQRGFLLVEGQHDLAVWDALLGDSLRDLRIELLPLRGAGRLRSILDSRVLYDFTDAHMFVVLDALNAELVSSTWVDACQLAKTDGVPEACAHVVDRLAGLKVDEAQALAAFMTRALELGLEGRHTPLGLEATDILDYLPVREFVDSAESWESLREELRKATGDATISGSRFKKWLISAKRADLSEQHITSVALGMDSIPVEFTRIIDIIRSTFSH